MKMVPSSEGWKEENSGKRARGEKCKEGSFGDVGRVYGCHASMDQRGTPVEALDVSGHGTAPGRELLTVVPKLARPQPLMFDQSKGLVAVRTAFNRP